MNKVGSLNFLQLMLVFVTGCQTLQSVEKLYITFSSDEKMSLLQSERVHLPLSHNTYQEFFDACISSITFSATAYVPF